MMKTGLMTIANFEAGQIWRLKEADKINNCDAVVLLVETLNAEEIVHIALIDRSGKLAVGHMPFARPAFIASIERLVGYANSLIDYEEGYNIWRSAYDAGDAGIFGVQVSDCAVV